MISGGKNEVMFCSSSIGSYLGLFVLGIRSNAIDHFKASASEGDPSYEKIKVARWLPQPICADVGQALPLAPGIRE
jgi:hypothetical protein